MKINGNKTPNYQIKQLTSRLKPPCMTQTPPGKSLTYKSGSTSLIWQYVSTWRSSIHWIWDRQFILLVFTYLWSTLYTKNDFNSCQTIL